MRDEAYRNRSFLKMAGADCGAPGIAGDQATPTRAYDQPNRCIHTD
jgi:hypothetical protein